MIVRCHGKSGKCETCDEVCSKRDGRKGRHDYRVKLPVSHEADVYIEELNDGTSSSQGYCKYSCVAWPYSKCQVKLQQFGNCLSTLQLRLR